jgi:hypothetical protein
MKNLMMRLKPEMIETMNKRKVLYPNTIKRLETELENTYFVSDIRYVSIVELESIAHETKFEYTNGWDFFNFNPAENK